MPAPEELLLEPDVDVVCVAYGSVDGLREALAAAPARGSGQLIVVDHGGDGSDAVARAAGAIVLRDPSNPGFGAGQNRGVGAGDAELVLLLNPDCILRPGALEAGVAHLAAHPQVAAVQGVIRSASTGDPERSQGRRLVAIHLWGRALGLRRLLALGFVRTLARRTAGLADHAERIPDRPTAVESLAATAILVRRTAFEQVGGFDPAFFLYGEDLDLSRRLCAAGWGLVALADEWAVHVGGSSSSSTTAREIVWWEGTLVYAARWWTTGSFVSGLGATVLRAAALSVRSPKRAVEIWRRLVMAPLRARRAFRRTA